jgi:magnesium transporter
MDETPATIDLDSGRVIDFVHRDFVTLGCDLTVKRAIEALQRRRDDDRILYFYVVDAEGALVGVMPARLFLTSDPGKKLAGVCARDLVTLDSGMSLREAATVFEKHRFLSLPVVDRRRRLIGVIDLHVFASRRVDLSDKALLEEVFQTIGIRLGGLVGAGPLKSWRLRFPWLISTLAGGALCVLVSGAFGATLASSLLLAIFLAPILALGESTAIQSMSIALQLLGLGRLGLAKALERIAREALTGFFLGASSGAVIFALETLWKGLDRVSLVIAASVTFAMTAASMIGFALPWILYRLRVNLKVAAGPIVLAVADVATILIYLGIATAVL